MVSGEFVHFAPPASTFNHFPKQRSIKKLPWFAPSSLARKFFSVMKLWLFGSTIGCAILFCADNVVFGQSPEKIENDTVRVTVSMNADGSRTVYKFDDAQHKAVATTSGQDGKTREKIRYEMDEAGRFSSGLVFGPDGHLRFKSRYKYDGTGRLLEEIQSSESDALLHKIVYSYDQGGKPTGYSIFDATGRLIRQTSPRAVGPTGSPKSRGKK